jgi:selenocysteine lyase/cysteine desulfurase
MVKDQWATHPWIDILGPELGYTYRLPVFSFTVSGLHHNFVNVLLNDLFGIQVRFIVS